jgi:dolichyl-phosphate-mannose--protein O-mannosyl transferase
MSPWRVLADVVMYLHILLPFLFVGLIVLSLIREVSFQWRLLYYVVIGVWIIMEIAPKFGWTKNCPLTDLEYSLRRLYDPSESWVRTRSLPATIIFNISGIEVLT